MNRVCSATYPFRLVRGRYSVRRVAPAGLPHQFAGSALPGPASSCCSIPAKWSHAKNSASSLWPEDTFVDFERGLNKAINKLRAALRDDAEKPRFIETLPQRGYRFIAPVECLPQIVQQSPSRIDSLAVLSLDNLSGDPTQEYFADGLTEELICAVARIGSLRVISRTSVATYKGSKEIPAADRERTRRRRRCRRLLCALRPQNPHHRAAHPRRR